jgi:acetyltransferase-like isoleucine patch superfamily enzyme
MQAVATNTLRNFIYVGRLVKEKKPDLLIRAFQLAQKRLGLTCNLIIVGDGPERAKLEQLAKPLGDRIQFMGHIADWEQLRDFYAKSIASVSPGYVGLSITQSFSFGVPMIIARNEPHAPEIEAATIGENSLFFEEGNAQDLADKLVETWKSRADWQLKGPAIAADCAERYSAEVMASRLIESAGFAVGTGTERPDRPVSSLLNGARSAVRAVRHKRHQVALRGKLKTGQNVVIGPKATLLPPEFAHFGDNVAIASDFHLETNLETGSDILISSKVSFVGNDHGFDNPESTVFWQGRNPSATVVLEGDNLIGFGVIVLGNVRIGKGCVVGAGAVVTTDLPPYTVCVGTPAKPIRNRYKVRVDGRAAA